MPCFRRGSTLNKLCAFKPVSLASSHIIRVSLGTLLVVLVNSPADLEAALENLASLLVVVLLLVQRDGNLWIVRWSTSWNMKVASIFLFAPATQFHQHTRTGPCACEPGFSHSQLTLKHSIAVPAWCWNAIFAMSADVLIDCDSLNYS